MYVRIVWIYCLHVNGEIQLIFYLLDNNIGSEGAQALAESLKQNTTLTQLNLSSMSELGGSIVCMFPVRSSWFFIYLVTGIGSEEAQALAESLKQNTTLTQLNLSSMSELGGSIVCMFPVRSS